MKSLKKAIRIWIATASLAGFMGGWLLLAHAGKPAPLQTQTSTSLTPIPTLPPLSSLNDGSFNSSSFGFQSLPSAPQVSSRGFPRLRTSGS
jgi:hypothetical protein